jgi:hypothetical protein
MTEYFFKTDFSLVISGDNYTDNPFCIAFRASHNTRPYFARYDGQTYTNCTPNEDGTLTVMFDHHRLGIGQLRAVKKFFIPDDTMPDGVRVDSSAEVYDVALVCRANNGAGGVIDIYCGNYDDKNAFASLTPEALVSMATAYRDSPASHANTGSVFYMLVRDSVTIDKVQLVAALVTTWTGAQIEDWTLNREDVTVNDTTYRVYGYYNRALAGSIMNIEYTE